MRVGVFGGSFDPVHVGHLKAAETCHAAASLDVVLFVPAASQPLKPHGPIASAQDRLRMLDLALEGRSELAVCPIEIERGGVSYTVETLRELTGSRPDDRLYLILGADALADLQNWREPNEICRLATLLVVDRPGTTFAGQWSEASVIHVAMEPIDVSSSEIRSRLSRGESIENLVPPAVAAFIADKGLYSRG
jgi:nicotinate-nucleotide adenylyltransferase